MECVSVKIEAYIEKKKNKNGKSKIFISILFTFQYYELYREFS